MAIEPGTRFGPYEVADEIGAGGMGVVYQATDTKLKRDVALKVLPESLATDAERLARFQREAEVLASLNHTNIAQIYGLEESDGTTALVMELVEGPTLADRIEQGAIPADEALGIALQIAEALEAAHGQSIVHRDLKPANIKLRPDGTVKVLDFGIAKALEPDNLTTAPPSPMLTTPATMAGVILGTAAYMSPEQAKGKPIDQRADIWAFGCVLYEMLTGQQPFGGEDVPTTLARVLERETDFDALPAAIPPAVRQTLELCLQKDERTRLHAIGDVRLALEGVFETTSPRQTAGTGIAQPLWRRALPVSATIVGTGLVFGIVAWALWPVAEPPLVNRFAHDLPEGQVFRNTGRPVIAISPDGRHIVYNTREGYYLRSMGELEWRLIPGTQETSANPIFSADSQSIAYYPFEDAQIKRIAITGGAPIVIAAVEENLNGASWGTDGTILFGQPEGVLRVAATGGIPELIIEAADGKVDFGPRLLPDGDSVLFSEGPQGDWDSAQIIVQSLSTGERKVLVEGGQDARYLPTGHIVYALEDGLFAMVFDIETMTVSGGAVPLVQDVMRADFAWTGAANYDVSDDGTLVYIKGDAVGTNAKSLQWVDREGRIEPVNAPINRNYFFAQLSPDGTRIAVSDFMDEFDVWIWDLELETFQRLTLDARLSVAPVWSPDGQRVAFAEDVGNVQEIYWQAADGSGTAEPLTQDSVSDVHPTAFLPDGSALLFMTDEDPADIWIVPVDGAPTAGTPLLATPADERSATVSPDGQWIAYQSDVSGQHEIYVRPFPNVDTARRQVSTAGGSSPVWSRDGSELFYYVDGPGAVPDAIMSVSVQPGSTFTPGQRGRLFEGPFPNPGVHGQFYDVSLDGDQFLMITLGQTTNEGEGPQIVVVQNWFEEVKRLAPMPE